MSTHAALERSRNAAPAGPVNFPRANMLTRLGRALAWRTFWRTQIVIFRAGPLDEPHRIPPALSLLRIAADDDNHGIPESAMAAAGEDPNLVADRFRNSDQFFAWQLGGSVPAFGWITEGPRIIGACLLPRHPGRLYLYNFHTDPAFRGRGLYPQLLLAIRESVAPENKTDLVIDVNARNTASLRGVEKAGFRQLGQTSSICLFRRWNWTLSRIRLDAIPPILK